MKLHLGMRGLAMLAFLCGPAIPRATRPARCWKAEVWAPPLQVQGVAATGEGVSAYQYGALAIVTVGPGSRGPGIYRDGAVTIQCNGANCPVQVPVSLRHVSARISGAHRRESSAGEISGRNLR